MGSHCGRPDWHRIRRGCARDAERGIAASTQRKVFVYSTLVMSSTVVVLAALALTFTCIGLGLFLDIDPQTRGGVPPRQFYFIMATLAVFLALQDMRMIAAGGPQGASRLRRHLGRMGGAMFIATGSFFLGQPQVFAAGPLEWVGLRALPVLAVATTTLYWMARLLPEGALMAGRFVYSRDDRE